MVTLPYSGNVHAKDNFGENNIWTRIREDVDEGQTCIIDRMERANSELGALLMLQCCRPDVVSFWKKALSMVCLTSEHCAEGMVSLLIY